MRSFADISKLVAAVKKGRVLQVAEDGVACQIGALRIIASNGGGWDHVSVSCATRLPKYREMQMVKRLFFCRYEWAMELHAPQSKHINIHPYTLHLWRPQEAEIPVPSEWMV